MRTKKLEQLAEHWPCVEEIKNKIENQFDKYDKCELILDCDHCDLSFTFSSLDESRQRDEILDKNLNNKKLVSLLNQTDLSEIEANLVEFETNLNLFKKDLFDLFKINSNFKAQTELSETQHQLSNKLVELPSIYTSYALQLDKFKLKLNYLKELLNLKTNMSPKRNVPFYNSIEQHIDLNTNTNQFKYKTNTTKRNSDTQQNEMLTNIHLDFHLNETLDESSSSNFYQTKTSTPRYRHIEIENTINPITGQGTSKFKQQIEPKQSETLLVSKSDKASSTFDDKSIQTEPSSLNKTHFIELDVTKDESSRSSKAKKKFNEQYRSLDSGIIMNSALDNTNITDIGSYSSSTPLTHFLNKTQSSTGNITRDKAVSLNASLPSSGVETKRGLEVLSPEVNKADLNMDEGYYDLRFRGKDLNAPNGGYGLVQNGGVYVEETEQCLEEVEDEEKERDEEEDLGDLTGLEEPKWKFSLTQMIGRGLLLSLLFTLFVYLILPIVFPGCCEFKRDYLFINERTYLKDDEMLPF